MPGKGRRRKRAPKLSEGVRAPLWLAIRLNPMSWFVTGTRAEEGRVGLARGDGDCGGRRAEEQ